MAKRKSPVVTNKFTNGWATRAAKSCPALVRVHWVDACISSGEVLEPEPGWEKSRRSGALMETMGFLLKNDDQWVTIGMERHAESDSGYRRIQDIPQYSVVKLEILKKST